MARYKGDVTVAPGVSSMRASSAGSAVGVRTTVGVTPAACAARLMFSTAQPADSCTSRR